MRRIGSWFIDKNYDAVYLIGPAPRENTLARYNAIMFYGDKIFWTDVFFRSKDWERFEPGERHIQRAVKAVFELKEEEK